MKKHLLTLSALIAISGAMAQQSLFERSIQGTGGQISDTLDNGSVVVLDLSTDDAEQENDEVDSYYDDDLDAGWEGAPEDQNLLTLGLRFTDINVLQGSDIDSAFVVFHAHEGKSAEDVAELTIVGEATDNAVTFDEDNFNENYLLTDRPQTTAQVEWTVDEDWDIWQPYKTSDIGSIIQEIVDRSGWEEGNAIALIFLPEDQGPSTVENAREFTSFENIADPDDVDPQGNAGDGTNHPERRPLLQIYVNGALATAEIAAKSFNFYPNPVTNGLAYVEFAEKSPAQVSVMNSAGHMVISTQTNEQRFKLNCEHLAAGLYMMRIEQNGETAIKKFIVQ